MIVGAMAPAFADAPDEIPSPTLLGLIGDVQIREAVDAGSLPAGAVHRFYVPAGRMPTGQDWLVPVVVIRGQADGPKLLLTAAVHGDELNGIAVTHRLIDDLDPATLSGTVTLVPGVNVPGMLAGTRNYPFVNGTGNGTNLNREMPGARNSTDPGILYAGKVWRGIIQGNADFAIDLHTQSTGTAYPLYAFADYRSKVVKEMAELLGAQMIKIDKGQKGTVETALNEVGVPAITLEIGGANRFDYPLIDSAVTGIKRLMSAKGMLPGFTAPPIESATIVGNDTVNVRAEVSGIVMRKKDLLDPVSKDEVIAESRDAFGRVVKRYTSPVDGHVASIATDPLREEGSLIIRILAMNKSKTCRYGC
jgi:hypothetical protein